MTYEMRMKDIHNAAFAEGEAIGKAEGESIGEAKANFQSFKKYHAEL